MIFLLFSCELHCKNYFWGQNMIEMYTPSVFKDNSSLKIRLAPLLSWKWCKKYGETLTFPSKICRHITTDEQTDEQTDRERWARRFFVKKKKSEDSVTVSPSLWHRMKWPFDSLNIQTKDLYKISLCGVGRSASWSVHVITQAVNVSCLLY